MVTRRYLSQHFLSCCRDGMATIIAKYLIGNGSDVAPFVVTYLIGDGGDMTPIVMTFISSQWWWSGTLCCDFLFFFFSSYWSYSRSRLERWVLNLTLEDYTSVEGYEPMPFIRVNGCGRLETHNSASWPSVWPRVLTWSAMAALWSPNSVGWD